MSNAVLIVRLLSILLASAAFGLSAVVLFFYVKDRRQDPVLPVENEHAVILAIAYIGVMVIGVGQVIEDVIKNDPFDWYTSPLLVVSCGAAIFGLVKLIAYERDRLKLGR